MEKSYGIESLFGTVQPESQARSCSFKDASIWHGIEQDSKPKKLQSKIVSDLTVSYHRFVGNVYTVLFKLLYVHQFEPVKRVVSDMSLTVWP